jgi:hypothetical protein
MVLRPTTKVVGIKTLPYFDPPRASTTSFTSDDFNGVSAPPFAENYNTGFSPSVHRRAVGARNVSKFQFHSENEESFHDRR